MKHRTLTEDEVYECRTRYMLGENMPILAAAMGVSCTSIRKAVRGLTHKRCMRVPPVLHGVRNMRRKVSPLLVLKLRAECLRGGKTKEMAIRTGIAYSTMYKILSGETFKWVN